MKKICENNTNLSMKNIKQIKKIRENTAVCYFLTSFHFRFHEKHHKSFSNVF